MTDEVCRVYSILVSHTVRKPTSPKWTHMLPIFVGCPDYPVYKRAKELKRDITLNDGLHFNGIQLIHPQSRLRGELKRHFRDCQSRYLGNSGGLYRIHVTPITRGNMADYTLKAFKNRRVDCDELLVLPRSVSELPIRR